jgi:hypothetical protein
MVWPRIKGNVGGIGGGIGCGIRGVTACDGARGGGSTSRDGRRGRGGGRGGRRGDRGTGLTGACLNFEVIFGAIRKRVLGRRRRRDERKRIGEDNSLVMGAPWAGDGRSWSCETALASTCTHSLSLSHTHTQEKVRECELRTLSLCQKEVKYVNCKRRREISLWKSSKEI